MRSDRHTFRGKGSLDIPGSCVVPFRAGRASGAAPRIIGVDQAGTLSESGGLFSDAECVAKVDGSGARKRAFYRFEEPVSEFRAILFIPPEAPGEIPFTITGASTDPIGGPGGVLLVDGITDADLDLTTLTWGNQTDLTYVDASAGQLYLLDTFTGPPDPGVSWSPYMLAAGSVAAGVLSWAGNVTCYGIRVMWIFDDAVDPADNVEVSSLGFVGGVHVIAEDLFG